MHEDARPTTDADNSGLTGYVRQDSLVGKPLSRGSLFRGCREGWWKSALLRLPGSTGGIRMVELASYQRWLAAHLVHGVDDARRERARQVRRGEAAPKRGRTAAAALTTTRRRRAAAVVPTP